MCWRFLWLSCSCGAVSTFMSVFAEHSLHPREMQKRDQLVVKQSAVPQVLWVQLIATESSRIDSSEVQALHRANMMDVMGMYLLDEDVPEMPSFGGRPVYSKSSDSNTLIWYYEGPPNERQQYDGWYGGPKEHMGTAKAMMKAFGSGRKWGARFIPPRSGWRISSMGESREAFANRVDALQVLRQDEMRAELQRGARLLRLWDASNRPRLTLGAGLAHSMSPLGIFEHNESHGFLRDDGRPSYSLNGPFLMHTHRVTLWWSMAMECWCIGLWDPARPEWQTCELRTHDAALLPEWITQPWQQLVDVRALTAGAEDLCEVRQGAVYFRGTPVRYVEAPGVRVVQLPLRDTHVVALWTAQQLWRLALLLVAAFLGCNLWEHLRLRMLAPGKRAISMPEEPPVPKPLPPADNATTKNRKVKKNMQQAGRLSGSSTSSVAQTAARQVNVVNEIEREVERVRQEAAAHAAQQQQEIERLRQLAARQEVVNEDAKLCVVCLSEEKRCMFRPCKHVCVCDACAATILSDGGACPLCRARVEDIERVYTS